MNVNQSLQVVDAFVGHVKTPRQKLAADNTIDITGLLAQAEAIKDNPDAYLVEEAVEAAA